MNGHRPPPRLLELILEWALPAGLSAQGTLGDLAEEFGRRALQSRWRARRWYAGQALSLMGYRLLGSRGGDGGAGRVHGVRDDFRWAFRAMSKHRGFSLAVVAVLGLGLGANIAVYSVLDGTLRNTSWWARPERTVAIWPGHLFSYGQLEMYGDEQAVYDALGGYVELGYAVRTPDEQSVSVNGVWITPELFRELAVQPLLGRALANDDVLFGAEPVVVIGEDLWRRSFAADAGILGSRITVGGAPMTVVGVQASGGMAPGGRAELWVPLLMDPRDDDFWKSRSLTFVGVMKDGVSIDDAFDDLLAYTDVLSSTFPMFFPRGYALGLASVAPADAAQRRLIETPLLLLFGGSALLLLVTALNVGNLLLGRAIDRRRELALRVAVGAPRHRVARQLFVEGLVLCGLAVALGVLGGAYGGVGIAWLFVEQAVVDTSSVISPPVLWFAAAIAAAAFLVVNLVPVAHFLRGPSARLSVSPASGAGMQRALVVVQSALATLLLVSATLLVATVDNLRRAPLGFDPAGIVTFELSTPADRVGSPPVARELYDDLVASVAALPGVEAVGLTGWLPLRAQAPPTPINLESAPVDPREAFQAPMQMVDPGFFATFGIEPVAGRLLGIDERDPEDYIKREGVEPGASAVVVNEALAAALWPEGDAVGQRIAIDPHAWDTWVPVVGVIPNIRSGEITGPIAPALYVSLSESPSRDVTMVVRIASGRSGLLPLIGAAVRGVDALVPLRAVADMRDVVRAAYETAWVMMGLLIVLAALATGLGVIGIYAVLARHVALHRREIGVRMALGAQPGRVVGGVVGSGLMLAIAGIAVGSVAAAMSTRYLESLLFEVSALAPWAFLAPAAALAAAAVIAAWAPATRAGRLSPAQALRRE